MVRLSLGTIVRPDLALVEVATGQYGLILKSILAGAERLNEPRCPTLQVTMSELFRR